MTASKKKYRKTILFAAAEGLPFIKSGGLADVVGSLPKALAKTGYEVRVVLPLYLKIAQKNRDTFKKIATYEVHTGSIHTVATYYETKVDNIIYYFVEHQGYFERDGMYGYVDDGERFAFFQKAVLELLKAINWFPDIIHSHDWHTGMIPVLCKAHYQGDERYQRIKHVYTIHNLAFQGNFPKETMSTCLGLDWNYFSDGAVRYDGGISFMKSGIVFSDKVTTVSPTYAQEIKTSSFGEGLDEVLRYRQHDLWGIVNGIDIDAWNPKKDKLLSKNYDVKDYEEGKAANKKAVQEELGLEQNPDTLMIGIVSRLTYQKGVNLIREQINNIMGLNVQFVVLGTGEKDAENSFKWMESAYKGRAVYYCGYNEDLAHRIYAGCDIFLMPSLYEPCGIGQLNAMRYGALPLVRETGGLKDTVQAFNQYTNEGNGFSFYAFNSWEMLNVIKYAHSIYYQNKEGWNALIKNAMNTDVSWAHSAKIYKELYTQLVGE